MQNSLNNDGLYRVYFNEMAGEYMLMHENIWNAFDDLPLYRRSFMQKLYAGTAEECIAFVKSQPNNPDGCIVMRE